MITGKQRKHMKLGSIAGVLALSLSWSALPQAQSDPQAQTDNGGMLSENPLAGEREDEYSVTPTPSEGHPDPIDAERDLLQQAALEPESLIGKTLRVEDDGKLVGEVLEVRRRLDNLFIYLVVDATEYFNAPTTYAIPVRDVERLEGGEIVMSYDEGMHIAGMKYRPEDYTSVENNFPEKAVDEAPSANDQ